MAIFEKKEKEKERLAKEKAEREEREGPTSTGVMVAFIIIKWLKDCFKNKKNAHIKLDFQGREMHPIQFAFHRHRSLKR